jgi:hypothetical protein
MATYTLAPSGSGQATRSTPINGNGAAAFYPGSEPGDCTSGTAASFDEARGDFELAWLVFLANRTEADFDEHRKHRAWTAWKYAMWDSGCKLPTQLASGQSRCFCGAVIDIKGHEPARPYRPHGSGMKFVEPSRLTDPDATARKLLEIANATESPVPFQRQRYLDFVFSPSSTRPKGIP